VEKAAADVVAHMVLLDSAPASPLTRALTLPLWGGVRRPDGQPAVVGGRALVGDLYVLDNTVQGLQQYGDWLVRQGLLALEGGDPTLARQRLTDAVGPAAPPLLFGDRPLAQVWLQLWK
jgi:hypothetical protein